MPALVTSSGRPRSRTRTPKKTWYGAQAAQWSAAGPRRSHRRRSRRRASMSLAAGRSPWRGVGDAPGDERVRDHAAGDHDRHEQVGRAPAAEGEEPPDDDREDHEPERPEEPDARVGDRRVPVRPLDRDRVGERYHRAIPERHEDDDRPDLPGRAGKREEEHRHRDPGRRAAEGHLRRRAVVRPGRPGDRDDGREGNDGSIWMMPICCPVKPSPCRYTAKNGRYVPTFP